MSEADRSAPLSRRALQDLMRKARSNTSVVVGGNIVVNVARFASTIVLTRLLTSADFGAIGITATLVFVFAMITDVGFYAYVLQHPRRHEEAFLDQLWTLRLLRGIALFAAIAASSGLLASFFGKPELKLVIIFAAAQLLFDGLTSMAFVTAARDGEIRRLTLLEVAPHLVSVAASIAAAFWLRNYWAFIVGLFAGGSVKVVLSYGLFTHSRRRWRPSLERARDLWSFGRHILASSTIELIISQADKIWLGRYLPLRTFGLYSLASNLAQLPASAMSGYSNRLLFPAFTKAHQAAPSSLAAVYYGSGRPMRYLYMAGTGFLVGTAPLIVELLYDARYRGAADYLRILAILPLLKIPVGIGSDLLIACGRVRELSRINLARLAALVVSAPFFWHGFGAIGIPIALACTEAAGQIYCWLALHRAGLLRPSREAVLLGWALAGMAAGYLVNEMGLAWIADFARGGTVA